MHTPVAPRRGGISARGLVGRRGTNAPAAPRAASRTITELLQSPERRNLPHLHPKKKDGALWFSIDYEIRDAIKKAFTDDFDGPWWNLGQVPLEMQDLWWSDFLQRYYWDPCHHGLVKKRWIAQLRRMISNNMSKAKGKDKKPAFVSSVHWKLMWEHWNTEEAIHKSKTNSTNRKSERDGVGMHLHTSGSKPFARVEYDMMMELGEKPAITELIRKTHTRKDGTILDNRAKQILEDVMSIVTSQQASMGADHGEAASNQESNSSGPITFLMLDEAFHSIVKPHKGRLFGIGTAQMEDGDSTESPAVAVPRQTRFERELFNLNGGFSTLSQQVKALCQVLGVTLPTIPNADQPSPPPTQTSPTETAFVVPSVNPCVATASDNDFYDGLQAEE